MRVIWKYALQGEDETVAEMPVGAEILTVQKQHGRPCVWALVDPDAAAVEVRRFRTYGTGRRHEAVTGNYIGTYQLDGGCGGGGLIFHVFEDR